jgi:catechol 2,3-dioxygenase-like lactoylglutathione lyase family enzyme
MEVAMSGPIAVRHLALRVRDIPTTRRFYEEGLGFHFLGNRPSSESLDLSDGHVNLTLLPYIGPERQPLEESYEFIHLGFWVEDLEAVYKRLVALNARVVREDVKERRDFAGDAPPVGSFKVLDPDGNVLDITGRADEWRY